MSARGGQSAKRGGSNSAERGDEETVVGEPLAIRGAVLGADVSRSRSPVIHQAAFRALGIPGDYLARSVSARGFRQVVAALAADGYRYVNVTIPHKGLAAALATTRSAAVGEKSSFPARRLIVISQTEAALTSTRLPASSIIARAPGLSAAWPLSHQRKT